MTGPDDIPTGDLYGEPSDYLMGWQAITATVTDPEAIGHLFVVRDGGEECWTLLDRQTIPFGFCR